MTTIQGGSVFDLTLRNKPVSNSVIVEDLNDFASVHSVGKGASGIVASNPYKRIVFVLSGKLDCRNNTTGHEWVCPAGSFTVFSENQIAGFSGTEDSVCLRIVVINPTEIYEKLEDEKAYSLKDLVYEHGEALSYIHILSCGYTTIWTLLLPEHQHFETEALHSNMVYMCLEGNVQVEYAGNTYELSENQCFYGLKNHEIRITSLHDGSRLLIMKDIL